VNLATTLMTLQQFESQPSDAFDQELIKGELIRLPPPSREHMERTERLFELLKAAVEQCRRENPAAGLGRVHMEMGYLVASDPASWVRPDVSLTTADQPRAKYYEGGPVIAWEIISEYDKSRDLERKIAEYLTHGTQEVWLIYPEERYARVHYAGTFVGRLEKEAVQTPLLPGVRIPFTQFL
jgi:Uma2 family endonuclease